MKKNIEIVERNSPVTKVILETLCSKTVFNLIARSNGELAKQVKIRGVWGRGHATEAILHKYTAPATEMPTRL